MNDDVTKMVTEQMRAQQAQMQRGMGELFLWTIRTMGPFAAIWLAEAGMHFVSQFAAQDGQPMPPEVAKAVNAMKAAFAAYNRELTGGLHVVGADAVINGRKIT